jgi:colanic acid biosynthesis glycosyl transferase WcaI
MSRKNKVLIHSIAFAPDGVSTAYIYNDIARILQLKGLEVTVLTTTPHYNPPNEDQLKLTKKWFGLWYTSNFNEIQVIHLNQKKYKSTILRLVSFIYWHLSSIVFGLLLPRQDLIIAPSPPLTIGLVTLIIGKLKGSKVIYNVQEIYPDFIINQGAINNVLILRFLKYLEKLIYNHSDAVTTIDYEFYQTIVGRFKEKEKLHIIPNFVDIDLYHPAVIKKRNFENDLFKDNGNLKLMYAGNIGIAQDWDLLINLAIKCSHLPVDFYVVGDGAYKSIFKQKIESNRLGNIFLIPYQKREHMPSLINFADLHFIFMETSMASQGFPSKVYTIMACNKPLLISSVKNSPIISFLKGKECAFLFSSVDQNSNLNEIYSKIRSILSDKGQLTIIGSNGLKYVKSNYSKDVIGEKYFHLINDLIEV